MKRRSIPARTHHGRWHQTFGSDDFGETTGRKCGKLHDDERLLASPMRVCLLSLLLCVMNAACSSSSAPPECCADGSCTEGCGDDGFATVTFPAGFRWGTALAQWQAEGDEGEQGAVDSNWSRWMAMGKAKGAQQNPRGNGFHTRYSEDIARAKELGMTQFRLGIDWSRVEPEPDVIDDAELDHFVAVLDEVRAQGMEPIVTLYHWVVPTWVQNPDPDAPGGALDRMNTLDTSVVDDWEAFVRVVIPRIKDRVDVYTVINEPLSMITLGYIQGDFPPGRRLQIEEATNFGVTLLRMHARAFDVIKEVDDVDIDGNGDDSWVGITMALNEITPDDPASTTQQRAAASLNYVYNDWALRALTAGALDFNFDGDAEDADTTPPESIDASLANTLEFIGVQYYGPGRVTDTSLIGQLLQDVAPLYGEPLLDVKKYSGAGVELPRNGMGREISAAGFRETIDRMATYNLPLFITENGTTTNLAPDEVDEGEPLPALTYSEEQAAMYVVEHLYEVGRAIAEGVDVRGYLLWTLVDNHEWVEGRLQRFGAFRVDFDDDNLPRIRTKVADAMAAVITAGKIDRAIWDAYVLPRYPTDVRAGPDRTTVAVSPVGGSEP
jgi:beta-glucosidase/6-phospho-beta-glucosidase/beta-galactosidase